MNARSNGCTTSRLRMAVSYTLYIFIATAACKWLGNGLMYLTMFALVGRLG